MGRAAAMLLGALLGGASLAPLARAQEAQAPEAPAHEILLGPVRVAGNALRQVVSVVVEGKPVKLQGELLAELARLSSVVVEVVGSRQNGAFQVETYRIVDVGGGAKPLVGELVAVGSTGLALRDGDGSSIPLSVPPRNKKRLLQKLGAKVWVHGKTLVTGELKLLRYGVLREPAASPDPQGAADTNHQPSPSPSQEK